jgi:hypothetical protein
MGLRALMSASWGAPLRLLIFLFSSRMWLLTFSLLGLMNVLKPRVFPTVFFPERLGLLATWRKWQPRKSKPTLPLIGVIDVIEGSFEIGIEHKFRFELDVIKDSLDRIPTGT